VFNDVSFGRSPSWSNQGLNLFVATVHVREGLVWIENLLFLTFWFRNGLKKTRQGLSSMLV
jgi:hypothetical protein